MPAEEPLMPAEPLRVGDREKIFLSGIVLAAGASARMGRPKQILSLGGRPMLQRSLDEAAASCLNELILVLGHRSTEILDALRLPARPPCRVVVNRRHREGQGSSLALGLGSTDPAAGAAAILLGDQPSVTAALIDRVAEAFLEAGSPAARPVYTGATGEKVPGHPVFLARHTWAELARLEGDRGARDLLRARPDWLYELPLGGLPPADIDTPEDWRRAQRESVGWC